MTRTHVGVEEVSIHSRLHLLLIFRRRRLTRSRVVPFGILVRAVGVFRVEDTILAPVVCPAIRIEGGNKDKRLVISPLRRALLELKYWIPKGKDILTERDFGRLRSTSFFVSEDGLGNSSGQNGQEDDAEVQGEVHDDSDGDDDDTSWMRLNDDER